MNAFDEYSRGRRRQAFSLDQLHDRVGSSGDAAVEIAGAKMRRDHVAHDPLGDDIGNRALETRADFETKFPVVLGDDQNDAVLSARAADFPGFGQADRVRLDGLGLGRRQHQHRDLAAFAALEIAQARIEISKLGCRERPGEVGDVCLERRHRDLRASRNEAREENAGRDEAEPASAHEGITAWPARRVCRNRPSAVSRWLFRLRR